MYKIQTNNVAVAVDGDVDNHQRENLVYLKLTGHLPFPPFAGMRIEAEVPGDRPRARGTFSIQELTWFTEPGGSGYWDAQCQAEDDGVIMTADEFRQAFRYAGWTVERE